MFKKTLFRLAVAAAIAVMLIFSFNACNNGEDPPNIPDPPPNPADKAKVELAALIELAELDYDSYLVSKDGFDIEPGSFYLNQESKDYLRFAIDAAKIILGNTSAVLEEVNTAIKALEDVMDEVAGIYIQNEGRRDVDLRALREIAAEADIVIAGVLTSSFDGNDVMQNNVWVMPEVMEALETALETAKGLLEPNPIPSSMEPVNAALAALTSALADFDPQPGLSVADKSDLKEKIQEIQDVMINVVPSDLEGDDVLITLKWVTSTIYNDLAGALDFAIQVADEPASPVSDVELAMDGLDSAFAEFEPKQGKIDKTVLNEKIQDAHAAMIDILTSDFDGKDVLIYLKWVETSVYNNLAEALEAAELVSANPDVFASGIKAALSKLETALNVFQPQPGKLIPGPDFISAKTINSETVKYSVKIELTLDKPAEIAAGGNAADGFTISRGSDILTIASAVLSSDGLNVTFTLAADIYILKDDVIKISYDNIAGSLVDADEIERLAEPYDDMQVDNMVTVSYNPWILKAAVDKNNPVMIQVTFNEPVHIANGTDFTVKVNDQPLVRTGIFTGRSTAILDISMVNRAVISAAPATSGNYLDTVWNLTMAEPAKHGEILRLSANVKDAYVDLFGVGLPAPVAIPAGQHFMSQFIIHNMAERNGIVSPAISGFYENGLLVTGFTSGDTSNDLYQRVITWLTVPSNRTTGATYTIVLGADQIYEGAATFRADQVAVNGIAAPGGASSVPVTASHGFTIVLAAAGGERTITVTGTQSGGTASPRVEAAGTLANANEDHSVLVLRNGVTLIIEDNIVIQHENLGLIEGTRSNHPLIRVSDGGKLIMDGGTLRGNYVVSGVKATSGNGDTRHNAGAVLIASSDSSSPNVGGIDLREGVGGGEAYFIMNGGLITGNTVESNARGIGAGGVGIVRKSFFVMQGGEIKNNTVRFGATGVNGNILIHTHAGGVAGMGAGSSNDAGSVTQVSHMHGFYMTGGSIINNVLENNGATQTPRISAGGVILQGTFQKTGGIISGNINNLPINLSSVTRAQIVVQHSFGSTAANHVFFRDADAGENVLLFIESIRNSHVQAASPNNTTFRPPFIPALGNGWEN